MAGFDITFGDDDEDSGIDDTVGEGNADFDIESFDAAIVDAPESDLPQFTALSKPVDVERLIDREVKKLERENKRQLREEQQEQRRRLSEAVDDTLQKQKAEAATFKAEAAERVSSIRSRAVENRIQAYSVSSALGLPGYIGASFVDQLIFRPTEEKRLAEEKEYRSFLNAFNQERKKEVQQYERAEAERIRNLQPQPVDRYEVEKRYTIPGPQDPRQPSQTQMPPPGPPPGGPPPSNLVPPLPPELPAASAIGPALTAVAAAVQVSQLANTMTEKAGRSANQLTQSIGKDTPYDFARNSLQMTKNVIDPLGTGVGSTIYVSGFDMLLSLTKDIRDSSVKNIAFSPLALGSSVEANIEKMIQQIDIAQRLDPLKAAVNEVGGRLDRTWEELKAELFETTAPIVIQAMEQGVRYLQAIRIGINLLKDGVFAAAGAIPVYGQFIQMALNKLLKQQQLANGPSKDLLQRLEAFHDPNPKAKVPNP